MVVVGLFLYVPSLSASFVFSWPCSFQGVKRHIAADCSWHIYTMPYGSHENCCQHNHGLLAVLLTSSGMHSGNPQRICFTSLVPTFRSKFSLPQCFSPTCYVAAASAQMDPRKHASGRGNCCMERPRVSSGPSSTAKNFDRFVSFQSKRNWHSCLHLCRVRR